VGAQGVIWGALWRPNTSSRGAAGNTANRPPEGRVGDGAAASHQLWKEDVSEKTPQRLKPINPTPDLSKLICDSHRLS